MSRRRVLYEASLGVFAGAAVLAATVAWSGLAQGRSRPADDYAFFDELIDVKHLISQRFVDPPDDKALREGAIKGMVEALNDPYTVYVPSAAKESFNKDLTGEYVGIGATVSAIDGWLTVVSPMEESPAFRAGLMAEDRIVEIDGKPTQALTLDACVDLLVGKPGTDVRLVIERQGARSDVVVRRQRIKTRSVKGFHRSAEDPNTWDYLVDPARGIAYVRLVQFTPKSANEVLQALASLGAPEGRLKGLVLDLRFNPGGLLNEAEAIADLFLEEGVIVSTRGRAYPESVARARKPGTLPPFPIAVLVNGQSASASEVLAGALVENDRAIAVGERTFGKGSVQVVLEVPGGQGAELKITEQGYFLPTGRSISRKDTSAVWGVDPTEGFYVPLTDEELIAMIEVRRREEILRAGREGSSTPGVATPADAPAAPPENWSDPEWILTALKDKQLAAAVRAVQGKVDTGEWRATGQKGIDSGTIAVAELAQTRTYRERLLRELTRADRRIDALEVAAPQGPDVLAAKDLWPDELDLRGGTIQVRDKAGAVVADLEVTGRDIERWLMDADVRKRAATDPAVPAPLSHGGPSK